MLALRVEVVHELRSELGQLGVEADGVVADGGAAHGPCDGQQVTVLGPEGLGRSFGAEGHWGNSLQFFHCGLE